MLRSRPEVGEVARQVAAPRLGLLDHRREAVRLVAEVLDLAIDAVHRVDEDGAALGGILGCAEPFAVALAGGLVLEQLADLREREPGVVAEAADEPKPLEVRGVVKAVVALGPAAGSSRPISS